MDIKSKPISVERALELFGDYDCYLYSQNSAWLPASKVNIFYGIWKRIIKQAGKSFFTEYSDDIVIKGDVIKCFGLAKISQNEFKSVVNSIAGDADNVLFFSTRNFDDLFLMFKSSFSSTLINVDFFNVSDKFCYMNKLLVDDLVFEIKHDAGAVSLYRDENKIDDYH